MAADYHCTFLVEPPQLRGRSSTTNDYSNDEKKPTTNAKRDYNNRNTPFKRHSQLEDHCASVYHEEDNNFSPQQESVFPSSQNISLTLKSKKYHNNRKTPAMYNHPSEWSILRGKEDWKTPSPNDQPRHLQHRGIKENIINHSNNTPQLKIHPYKRDNGQLYVGGLPAGITREEFRHFFENFGIVLDSVIILDRNTKRSRGFGFVTFEDPRVAHKLLHYNVNTKDKYYRGYQTAEAVGSDSNTHVTSTGQSGSIFIHGKRCVITATNPKKLLQNPCNSLGDTGSIDALNSYKAASFNKATLPSNYSGQPSSYSCDFYEQIQHVEKVYQYPNGIVGHMGDDGEHYAKPFSVDSGTWPFVTMTIPQYSPVAYTAKNKQLENTASVRIINGILKL